ncbi:hypothetical protein LIER_34130 [Lithospermum erythrorhizon]|uniref:Uncharacterized protein n=1 Tax=Lithospermum erythrorhizon TaxID=34254 RepID=A0AAV3S2B1_LITER
MKTTLLTLTTSLKIPLEKMANKCLRTIALHFQEAIGKRKAAERIQKMTARRSMSVERETETLNHARQLVYKNDSVLVQATSPHLGGQAISPGAFHQTGNLSDPTLMPFRQVYPPQTTRLFPGSSSTTMLPQGGLGQPPQQYMYQSPPPSRLVPYTSQYQQPHLVNDYYIGHAVPGNITSPNNNMNPYVPGEGDPNTNNYTCIGAPVSRGPDGLGGGIW